MSGNEKSIEIDSYIINEFFQWYINDGFGAKPKLEIDIRIFNILYQNYFKELNNYQIASKLKITEQKVKSLIITSEAKFPTITKDEALLYVFNQLKEKGNFLELEPNGEITLIIENPKIKSEFSYAAKEVGCFTDYSFNDELLKFKPHVFISILLNMDDKLKNDVLSSIKENLKNNSNKGKILNKALPLNKKIEKYINENKEKLGLLIDVIGLVNPTNLFKNLL